MNWTTGEYERGTSVYPAKFVADGVVGLDFEDDEMRRWDIDHEAMEGRLWWPVTGKEVCRGSDGEPVLQPSSVTARPFAIKHGWMKELYS